MKTMITRNNVPRHNGTMRCLLGRKRTAGISGHYSEAWAIAPRLGAEACGRHGSEPGAGGSHGSCREAGGRQGRGRKGCGRSGRGPEGRGKVRKRREGTESNGTLHCPLIIRCGQSHCSRVRCRYCDEVVDVKGKGKVLLKVVNWISVAM